MLRIIARFHCFEFKMMRSAFISEMIMQLIACAKLCVVDLALYRDSLSSFKISFLFVVKEVYSFQTYFCSQEFILANRYWSCLCFSEAVIL